jgi:phosphoribosylpyrophosphate synthetase
MSDYTSLDEIMGLTAAFASIAMRHDLTPERLSTVLPDLTEAEQEIVRAFYFGAPLIVKSLADALREALMQHVPDEGVTLQ